MSGFEGFFDSFLKSPSSALKVEDDVSKESTKDAEHEAGQPSILDISNCNVDMQLLSPAEDSLCSFSEKFDRINDFFNNPESSQSYGSHTDHSKNSTIPSSFEDCNFRFGQSSQSTSERMPSSGIPAPVHKDTYDITQKLGEPGGSDVDTSNEIDGDLSDNGHLDSESEHSEFSESENSIDPNGTDNESDDGIDEGTETEDKDEYQVPDSQEFPKRITRIPDAILTRKRGIYESEWKTEKAKKAKLSGTEGQSKCGKPIAPAKMGFGCGTCRFKCQKKITIEQRQFIYKEFWSLKDHNRQWDYINKYTETKKLQDYKRRNVSNKYYLKVSYKTVRVCQKMFNDTLGISTKMIRTINKKIHSNKGALEADQRGKHLNRPNRIDPAVRQSVNNHIESFPVVESHYCRQTTNKTYLESGLSLHEMYKKYTDKMKAMNNECASEHMYREIFGSEYNIAFHQPKKDLCNTCNAYSYLSEEAKTEQAEEYDLHLENKRVARELMAEDKEEAKKNDRICAACFDVEQTLTTPRGYASVMYYKRKLNVYNFTVYELATHQGWCYVWNETDGGKGANEISSCLWNFIKKKAESGVDDFRFYSDNCGAQNRNKMLYSMYTRASTLFKVKIQHRYLEKGHTYNEGDSMHATIENSCKNKAVFTQNQWCDIMRSAKKNEPFYIVNELSIKDILNFRELANDQNWKAVKISTLREIVVSKDETNVLVKYEYAEQPQSILIVTKKCIGKSYPLTQVNTRKISLDKEKINDLQKMCYDDKVIPQEFHSFYESLIK